MTIETSTHIAAQSYAIRDIVDCRSRTSDIVVAHVVPVEPIPLIFGHEASILTRYSQWADLVIHTELQNGGAHTAGTE